MLLAALNILIRLYNLTVAKELSPLEQLADVKQQLNHRGLPTMEYALASTMLAMWTPCLLKRSSRMLFDSCISP